MKSFKIELSRSEVEDMVRERFNIPSYMLCSSDFPKGKIILSFDRNMDVIGVSGGSVVASKAPIGKDTIVPPQNPKKKKEESK
jgi:hypothetical protein